MATAQRITGPDNRFSSWFKQNQRTVTTAAIVLAVVAGVLWFWWTARERREAFAERALASARGSAEAGNLPLASSDLARMVSSYSGTRAAQEATLLLAQVKLLQNQPALAVADLQKFIGSNPRTEFRGPANGLLASALEEAGKPIDAGKAYEAAAAATGYKGVKAQYLMDAARTYTTAGDTASAARLYEQVSKDFKNQSSGVGVEAQIRLTEIRKSALNRS